MLRVATVALLLCPVLSNATSAPLTKVIEVEGVRLPYVEHGSGEPIVFVHGAMSDLRAWEPVGEEIAKKYRFIAYTQRYYGTDTWKADGKEFRVATHANDISKLISPLNAGPVHLFFCSYACAMATTTGASKPSMIRACPAQEPL